MLTVCFSLILPYFVMKFGMNDYKEPSFISYKPQENETLVIKAITVNPFEGQLEGYLHSYRVDKYKKKLQSSDPRALKRIIMTSTDIWNDKKDEILEQTDVLAIIVVCKENLRPSSPLPALLPNSTIPLLIIR